MRGAKKVSLQHYHLRLYITGKNPHSQRALANLKNVCEEYLKERHELEVIDIYQRPNLAKSEQIIAAPTLIKVLPHPLRRIIGDLSDTGRLLIGLDLKPAKKKLKKGSKKE